MEIDKPNRRTVLKGIGASVVGSTVLTGSAAAHGNDQPRFPVWFEDSIWEMTERQPFGDLEDESTAPLWNIAPGAGGRGCAQLPGFDLSPVTGPDPRFGSGWDSVDLDHVASAFPFSALWHVHFVFGPDASAPYVPSDLVNSDGATQLTSTSAINNADITEISVPFGFNCPIRPAQGDHANYCQ